MFSEERIDREWDHWTRVSTFRRNFYNTTAHSCADLSQTLEHTDIPQIYKPFAQVTLSYSYEIDSNHQNILLLIGQEVSLKIKIRRGFGKTIGRLANVLYGAALNLDTEFIFNKVSELMRNKQQNNNFMKDKIRIVQTEISEAIDTLQHIIQNEQKIENNILLQQSQVIINTENINKQLIKEILIS